jgi:molecular chaperone GrpE
VPGAATATAEAATAEAAKDDAAESALTPEQREIARLKVEVAELKKELIYSHAERENMRKILQRDIKDAKDFGMRDFAKSLLDVIDNFERALDSVKTVATAPDASTDFRTFYEGVQMTEVGVCRRNR